MAGRSASIDQMPFSAEYELVQDLNNVTPSLGKPFLLPGNPRIDLRNVEQLTAFMYRELRAKDLDDMAPKLWVLSTQSSANISPLHRQQVKHREIVVTEDPKLHLVWMYDRVFIKPLPRYLMSRRFWAEYLLDELSPLGDDRKRICEAALGFLRSYYYLIVHESDFTIACKDDARLLPANVTWAQFCDFSTRFKEIRDSQVSTRYHYGELRLTRLNLYAKLFLRKFQYEQIHGQYGAYFSRFYGPLLFIFAICSLFLSAMQVELGVETLSASQWESFWDACRWFSVLTMGALVFLTLSLIVLLVGMILNEWIYAIRCLRMRKRQERLETNKA